MIVSLMLVAAVMASLALGVLVSYGLCQIMFRLFRVHAVSVSRQQRTGSPVVSAIAKG